MQLPVLPTYYYLDHFTEMLSFVRGTYGSILADEHHAFIARFERLPKDAQCLLIRMINRRGTVFDRHLFKYAEISDLETATSDLKSCGYARGLRVDDFAAFLACLPKTILIQGAKAAGFSDVRTSWPKPKLIEFFLAQIDFDVALEFCGGERFIALDNTRPIDLLLYLYFGKTEEDLKNFALRDLGVIRTTNKPRSARVSGMQRRPAPVSTIASCWTGSRYRRAPSIRPQPTLSWKARPAPRITRPISPAAPRIRQAYFSRRQETSISPSNSFARDHRRNAMSGSRGSCTRKEKRPRLRRSSGR